MTNPTPIGLSNQRLLELNLKRRREFALNPELIYPWRRKCAVKVLLVTDGSLDFSQENFGLSAFVNILQNDAPPRVNFQITLAHLRSDVLDAAVMNGAPGIVRSIKGFRFDEASHFTADMYDQVWLFGYETYFHFGSYQQRNDDKTRYPADRLNDAELNNIFAHCNRGGGLFATGDHGAIGRGLCGTTPRVRSMRYWDSFLAGTPPQDEVSMGGPRRNDTNQIGPDASSQFDDQSDDIPQPLDLVLYNTPVGFLRSARYPHPVFCGRTGRIKVFPDHPHEGQCRTPADVTLKFNGTDEYPFATGGSARIEPEIIAYGHVPENNTSGGKDPTEAHSFPVASAYDGHRAGVGRIICDSTWHHFVNINLIGDLNHTGSDTTKDNGFLSSPSGQAAFDKIKNYFTNIGVWISPPTRLSCFNRKVWWELVYTDRIMEAVLVNPNVAFEKIPLDTFYAIGVHARDVFGRRASQCQTLEWIIDIFTKLWPEVLPWIDPWNPVIDPPRELPLPIFDPQPLLDVALGAALVALRQAHPYPPEKFTDKLDEAAQAAALKGARLGLEAAVRQTAKNLKLFGGLLKL